MSEYGPTTIAVLINGVPTFLAASLAYLILLVWRWKSSINMPAYTILEPALMAVAPGGTLARTEFAFALFTDPHQFTKVLELLGAIL
jgi:hypothetical protein